MCMYCNCTLCMQMHALDWAELGMMLCCVFLRIVSMNLFTLSPFWNGGSNEMLSCCRFYLQGDNQNTQNICISCLVHPRNWLTGPWRGCNFALFYDGKVLYNAIGKCRKFGKMATFHPYAKPYEYRAGCWVTRLHNIIILPSLGQEIHACLINSQH